MNNYSIKYQQVLVIKEMNSYENRFLHKAKIHLVYFKYFSNQSSSVCLNNIDSQQM